MNPFTIRSRLSRGGLCLALSCWIGALGSACGEPPRRPNLVLIVVDTLRADRLGAWGYARPTSPAIDAFAADAIRFERAYSTAPWTKPSVASMLTGLLPSMHGTQKLDASLSPEVDTLAEILQRMDFATGAVVSHDLIGALYGFSQGFEHFDQSEARGHGHVSTEGVNRASAAMLDTLERDGRPFFLMVHYFDPHFDYRRHPEYGFSADGAGRLVGNESMPTLRRMGGELTEEEVGLLRDAYDEEIRHTDEGIGGLLDMLRTRDLYDESVIVLVADHGEEFREHGWIGHTRNLYEGLIHVPLIMRLPAGKAAGRVVDRPVSLLALAPTVLDAMGFDASQLDFQHGSLLPQIRDGEPSDDQFVYSEVDYDRVPRPKLWPTMRSANMRALILGRYKILHDRGPDRFELYDVVADPEEQRDLSQSEPERLHAMQHQLDAASERAQGSGAHEAPRQMLGPDERERLRALGYLDE